MASFRIEFKLPEAGGDSPTEIIASNLVDYPDISDYELRTLELATYGDICIIFDNVLQRPSWTDPKYSMTDRDWLWEFFMSLIIALPQISHEQMFDLHFQDDPLILSFQRVNNHVEILLNIVGDETIGKTTVPFQDFKREILETTDEFIKTLLEINPKLEDWPLIEELRAARKEANKVT